MIDRRAFLSGVACCCAAEQALALTPQSKVGAQLIACAVEDPPGWIANEVDEPQAHEMAQKWRQGDLPTEPPKDAFVSLLRSGAIDDRTFANLMSGRPAVGSPYRVKGHPVLGGSYYKENVWSPVQGAAPNSGKVLLKVHFLNGTPRQRRLVAASASEWTTGPLGRKLGTRLQFQFYAEAAEAQVRVSFGGGSGNWSKVGSEPVTQGIPLDKPTMNLDDVNAPTIRHEFGHVLGLRHEHQNSKRKFHFLPDVVIRKTRDEYGWSKAKTVVNILVQNPGSSCPVVGGFDYNSVMMYPFPASWTREHIATHSNPFISPVDRQCVELVYGASSHAQAAD